MSQRLSYTGHCISKISKIKSMPDFDVSNPYRTRETSELVKVNYEKVNYENSNA